MCGNDIEIGLVHVYNYHKKTIVRIATDNTADSHKYSSLQYEKIYG